MSSTCPRVLASIALFSTLSFASKLQAAPCGRPDVDVTLPPSHAKNVPVNAMLAAHYGSPPLYNQEPVSLQDANQNEIPISVSYDKADSMLRAFPDQQLAAGAYTLVWPGLRSSSSGGVGRGSTVTFSVQNQVDSVPPSFPGLTHMDWDLSRDHDPCLDGLEDRFVFELELGQASDDSDRELLSVLVFETEDPLSRGQAEPKRVALLGLPESGKVEVRRPASKSGNTCFAAVVQDLVGNVSGGGEVEVCQKTKKPPFFDGCSLSRAPADPPAALAWLCLALAGSWLRRGSSARAHPKRRAA